MMMMMMKMHMSFGLEALFMLAGCRATIAFGKIITRELSNRSPDWLIGF
jgi:hypothetical protein